MAGHERWRAGGFVREFMDVQIVWMSLGMACKKKVRVAERQVGTGKLT